jgi:hypothetical protein
MVHRAGILVSLLAFSSFSLFDVGIIDYAHARQNFLDDVEQQTPKKIHGKVTEVIQSAGYTYAEVDTGGDKVWAAASTTSLEIGDMIAFTTEMPMQNFHSSSLNRDFPIIYFVNRFITDKASVADSTTKITSPHTSIKPASPAKVIEGINKVEGGNTIAEVYNNKQKLSGKVIRVRGQVTKYTVGVMGKNWLHIRDSSTLDDLTVTTGNKAAVDAVVVIEGKVALDKDFGYGYVYPLMVEDASVTIE